MTDSATDAATDPVPAPVPAPVPDRVDAAPRRKGLVGVLVRFLSSSERLLRWSAVLTLIALVLMVWSMAVPTPLPVMVAMTLGQAIGTLAFAMFGYVVVMDLARARRDRHDDSDNETRP